MNDEIIEITRSGYESLQREVELLRQDRDQAHVALQKAKECLLMSPPHRGEWLSTEDFQLYKDSYAVAITAIEECGL